MSITKQNPTLYYIHDPMCSWCWGFRACYLKLFSQLDKNITLQYVLGGLAADTTDTMPASMQKTIHQTWQKIQTEIPGTEFNFDFWTQCTPRRSTYAACRAVLAAKNQDHAQAMLFAIQQAYYLHALNPSDDDTLIELARELNLNTLQFEEDLNSNTTQQKLNDEFELRNALYVHSFPSLVFEINDKQHNIHIDYNNPEIMLSKIHSLL